jgi:diaminopimelate epimerase
MRIDFSKYQATGNDFMLVDNREKQFPEHDNELIARLCHRKFGIGADGLILLQSHEDFDFEMVYFNADGKPGSFCGNGSRAAVRFAEFLGMVKLKARFLAADGLHEAWISPESIQVKMIDVDKMIPTEFGFFLDTGSPHVIIPVDNLVFADVDSLGKKVRHDPIFFPGGTNVNFVSFKGTGIQVRTYERGVEAETLSCGTGVTASALASTQYGKSSPVNVETPGGMLEVTFNTHEGIFDQIYLSGAAIKVFDGHINL